MTEHQSVIDKTHRFWYFCGMKAHDIYSIIINGVPGTMRRDGLRRQVREAESDADHTEELTKQLVRCQRNLTGLRRLFEGEPERQGPQILTDALQQRGQQLHNIEDWLDGIVITAHTPEEALRDTLRRLEKILYAVEDDAPLMGKWNELYADAFYYLNRKDYGEDE